MNTDKKTPKNSEMDSPSKYSHELDESVDRSLFQSEEESQGEIAQENDDQIEPAREYDPIQARIIELNRCDILRVVNLEDGAENQA